MSFKKSRKLMWTGFALSILVMAFGIGFENEKITLSFMVGGTVVFFLAIVQALVFYRCPHCGYSLMNVRGNVPNHCPSCGKELKED